MRIAVYGASGEETERLCVWVRQRCAYWSVPCSVVAVNEIETFWSIYEQAPFQGAVLGPGDAAGFLAARRLWERDKGCAVLLIGDTDRFAIQSLRLHVADFLVRPLGRERVERGVDKLLSRL